jgi:aminopeptidase 2
MCSTKDQMIAQETLEYSMSKAKEQDVYYFFSSLSSNKATKRILAKFLQDNYDAVRSFRLCFVVSFLNKL